ncbi:MAG: hypothetical protein KGI49_02580 [Patescibacteria group bacterium]|nr:hypothetical protein [Patescibacteria group bacterium]
MEIIHWNDKVDRFIDKLDADTNIRVRLTVDLLEKYGNMLGMPDSKPLGKGL